MNTINSNITKTPSNNCSNNSLLSNKSNKSKKTRPLNTKKAVKLVSQLSKYRRRRYSVEKLISDESDRVQKMEARLKKLKNVDLYEKNATQNLYDWPMLFNSNTKLNFYYNKNAYNRKKEKVEIEKNPVNSPVILIDLPDDYLKKFFGYIYSEKNHSSKKNSHKKIFNVFNSVQTENSEKRTITNCSISKNSISNNNCLQENIQRNIIRPVSINSARKPNDTFYFSNAFNDYYKEDFKTFANKIPALKAKVKNKKSSLFKELKKQKLRSDKKERKLYNVTRRNYLRMTKDVLIIAGERKNAQPLLKQIYDQINPNNQKIKKAIKYYYKTDKPFGNSDDKIDYTFNDRWKSSNEISKLRKSSERRAKSNMKSNIFEKLGENNKKRKLILSYYDNRDPHIKLFNNIISGNKDETEKIPSIVERNKNYEKENNNVDILKKKSLDEKNETKKNKKKVTINNNDNYFLTQTNVNV